MSTSNNKITVFDTDKIQNLIYTMRDVQVMLDSDLAELYNVKTGRINEQVKRNVTRFPKEFMFQLTKDEYDTLMSQIAISTNDSLRSQNATLEKGRGEHRKYMPYVFTEQGVAMLSSILRSETAVKVSIQIIDAFVGMRKFISQNAGIFQRLENVELKQLEADKNFKKLFDALQSKDLEPKQGIFFDGQIFDAYKFVSGLIRKANKSILLIDNYIDETVLDLLTKKKKNVAATIFTNRITKAILLDVEKFNSQYSTLELKKFTKAHDRFLIIDDKYVYHFGASLKDLGKKWFAFSKFNKEAFSLLENLKKETTDD